MKFKIFKDVSSYFSSFCNQINLSDEIPVYVSKDRLDLERNITNYSTETKTTAMIAQSDFGIVLSKELESYKKFPNFAKKWVQKEDALQQIDSISSILVLALYSDFTQENILDLLTSAKQKNKNIYLLVGRDFSSISWFIAKQFVEEKKGIEKKNGLFSYKKLNTIQNKDWSIYDIRQLEKENIKKILKNNSWESLIFHGHGKEDHLNLADYTLTGFNSNLPKVSEFAPSVGHQGQTFFKDKDKAIQLHELSVEKVFCFSCNNLPFNDSRLYDERFNLILDLIDGTPQNIVASLSVQSADTPELREVMRDSSMTTVGTRLENKLSDIQTFPSIITIGLPENKQTINQSESAERLSEVTKNILNRISSYSASRMLSPSHEVFRLSQKIFNDYVTQTRRGTFGVTKEDYQYFEKSLINRVNPLSKKIAEIMWNNTNDELQEFDNYNIYRSIVKKTPFAEGVCVCGGHTHTVDYDPELVSIFPLRSTYCYKCGDKETKMLEMPEINFTCDEFNEHDLSIKYQIEIIPKQLGDVFYSAQLPSYIEKSVINKDTLHRIKFKSLKKVSVDGVIFFESNTILQSYYLKLFAVQNAGIAFNRAFFNLI